MIVKIAPENQRTLNLNEEKFNCMENCSHLFGLFTFWLNKKSNKMAFAVSNFNKTKLGKYKKYYCTFPVWPLAINHLQFQNITFRTFSLALTSASSSLDFKG